MINIEIEIVCNGNKVKMMVENIMGYVMEPAEVKKNILRCKERKSLQEWIEGEKSCPSYFKGDNISDSNYCIDCQDNTYKLPNNNHQLHLEIKNMIIKDRDVGYLEITIEKCKKKLTKNGIKYNGFQLDFELNNLCQQKLIEKMVIYKNENQKEEFYKIIK